MWTRNNIDIRKVPWTSLNQHMYISKYRLYEVPRHVQESMTLFMYQNMCPKLTLTQAWPAWYALPARHGGPPVILWTHGGDFGHMFGYSRGDVGHTNGVMARFLDMSWDLILSVFWYTWWFRGYLGDFCNINMIYFQYIYLSDKEKYTCRHRWGYSFCWPGPTSPWCLGVSGWWKSSSHSFLLACRRPCHRQRPLP